VIHQNRRWRVRDEVAHAHPSREALAWRDEAVTLRWVLMPLIKEPARRNGRIGFLREMADGGTGR
jgi:hypothetical protein